MDPPAVHASQLTDMGFDNDQANKALRMSEGNIEQALNLLLSGAVDASPVSAGGSGGLIAVDKYGNISMPFNSAGMYRGYAKPNERYIGIYKDE